MSQTAACGEELTAWLGRFRKLRLVRGTRTYQDYRLLREAMVLQLATIIPLQDAIAFKKACGLTLMELGEFELAKEYCFVADKMSMDSIEAANILLQRAECDLQIFLHAPLVKRSMFVTALLLSMELLLKHMTEFMSSLGDNEADKTYWMVANVCMLTQRALQSLLEASCGHLSVKHGALTVFLLESTLVLTTAKYLGLRLRLYACAISCFEALDCEEGYNCALKLAERLLMQVNRLEEYEMQDMPVPEATVQIIATCKRAALVRIFKAKTRLLGEGEQLDALAEEMLGIVKTDDGIELVSDQSQNICINRGRNIVSCLRELLSDRLTTLSLRTDTTRKTDPHIEFILESVTSCASLELENFTEWPNGTALQFLDDILFFIRRAFMFDCKKRFLQLLEICETLQDGLQVRDWECKLFRLLQPLKFPDEETTELPKAELSEVDGRLVPIRSIEEIAQFLYECMKSATADELEHREVLLVGTALYLWSPFCIAMFETVSGFEDVPMVPTALMRLTLESLIAVQWVLEHFKCGDIVLRSRVCITLAVLTGFVRRNPKDAVQTVRRGLAAIEQARATDPIQEKMIADLEVDLYILLFTFEIEYSRDGLVNAEKLLHKEFKQNSPARSILSACYARTEKDVQEKILTLTTSLRFLDEAKTTLPLASVEVDEFRTMKIVRSSGSAVTLRVSKSPGGDECDWYFKVYGKLFSNTEVSTNNCDLEGTGIIIQGPAGNAYKDVTIRGLKSNASYRFAIGVCTKGGSSVGKLGASSGPVLTVNPLPLFRCYSFIRFCLYEALPMLNNSETKAVLKLFGEAGSSKSSEISISGTDSEVILWKDNPMDLLQLELCWNNASSRVSAQAFIHSLFVEQEVQHKYLHETKAIVLTRVQIQSLQSVQKMLMAAQAALLLQDNSLALQACAIAYNNALPCLGSILPDHRLTGALVTIHKVLERVPRNCWKESTFQIYCRVSFALYRLCLSFSEVDTLARCVLESDFVDIIQSYPEARDLKTVIALDPRLNHILAQEAETEAETTESISEESVHRLVASGEHESLDEAWRLISVSGSEHHERYLPLAYLTFMIALRAKHEGLPKWISEFHESLWDIHHTAESSLTQGTKDVLMEEEFRELPFSCAQARTYPFYEETASTEVSESLSKESKDEEGDPNEEEIQNEGDNSLHEDESTDEPADDFNSSGKRLYESQLSEKERTQLFMLSSLELCLAMKLDEKVSRSLEPVTSTNPGHGPYSCIEFKLEDVEKEQSLQSSAVPPLDLLKNNTPESPELPSGQTNEGLGPRTSINSESVVSVMQIIRSYAKSIHRSRWAEATELARIGGRRLWNFILQACLSPNDFKAGETALDWRYFWVVSDCLLETALDKHEEVWREKLIVFTIKVLCVLGLQCETFALGRRFLALFGQVPGSSANAAVVKKLATHVCNTFIDSLSSKVSQEEVVYDSIKSRIEEIVRNKQGRRSRKYHKKSQEELELEESLELKKEELRTLNERIEALREEAESLQGGGAASSQAGQSLETARRLARQAALADAEPGSSWISRAVDEIKSTARSKGSSRTFAGLSARSGISSASQSPRSKKGHSGKRGTSRRMEVDGNTRLWRQTVSAYTKTINMARERQETIVLAAAYSEVGDVYVSAEVADAQTKAVSAWKSSVDSVLQEAKCSAKWREILGSIVAKFPPAGVSEKCDINSPELIGQSCLKAYGLDGCILAGNCATKVAVSLEACDANEAIDYLRLASVLYSSLCSYALPHPTRKIEYVDYDCMDLPKAFEVALNKYPVIALSETISSMLTAITTLVSLRNSMDLLSVLPLLRSAQLIVDTYVKDDDLSRSVRQITADVLIELGYISAALGIINRELSTSFAYVDTVDADDENNRECLQHLAALQSNSQEDEEEHGSEVETSKHMHAYLSRIVCSFILRASELSCFQTKKELLEKLDLKEESDLDDPSWMTLRMRVWLSTRQYSKVLDCIASGNALTQPCTEHCKGSTLLNLLEWTKRRCLLSEALLCLRRLDDSTELCEDTLKQLGSCIEGGPLYDLVETKANSLLMVGKGREAHQLLENATRKVESCEDYRLARLLLKYSSLSQAYAYCDGTQLELEQANAVLLQEMENFGLLEDKGLAVSTKAVSVYLRCWPVFVQVSMHLKEDKKRLERAVDLTRERLPFTEREHSHLLHSLAILKTVSAPTVSAIQNLLSSLTSAVAWGNEYSLVLHSLETLYLLFAFHEIPQVSRAFASATSCYCLCAAMEVRRKQMGVSRAEEVEECSRVADLSGFDMPNGFEESTTYKDIIVRCFQANQEYLLTFHPAVKEESYQLHCYLKDHLDYYREECSIDLGTLPDIDNKVHGQSTMEVKSKTNSIIVQWLSNTPVDDAYMLLCVHFVRVDSSGALDHSNHRFVVGKEDQIRMQESLERTNGELERENKVRAVLGLDVVENSTIDSNKLEGCLRGGEGGEGGFYSDDGEVVAWWESACQCEQA